MAEVKSRSIISQLKNTNKCHASLRLNVASSSNNLYSEFNDCRNN